MADQTEIASVEVESMEEPTAEDYERFPVEEYGMAMLRKMGFKENEGIGLTNKAVIAPVQVHSRPRGVGLGATAPKQIRNVSEALNSTNSI